MKTIFLFFGSLLFSLFIRAQTIDTAYMECWYKFSYINLPLETMGEDLMVLQIGKNCSKFYSQYTQECDSLNATPKAGNSGGNFFCPELRPIISRMPALTVTYTKIILSTG